MRNIIKYGIACCKKECKVLKRMREHPFLERREWQDADSDCGR